MRHHQMELRDFRTPQHPSLGTNNWGGASPLLARNVPVESLEQKYLKLHSIRTRDGIFPVVGGDEYGGGVSSHLPRPIGLAAAKGYPPSHPGPSRAAGRGLLSKLMIGPRKYGKAEIRLGSNSRADENGNQKKKRWLPRWDPRNRWPQGWC